MSDTKSTKRRVVGLGDSESVHLRLTTPQADWLRSTAKREAISIASVVRGMIDAEQRLDKCEAESAKHQIAPRPEVVRGVRLGFPSMCAPGGDPTKIYGLTAVCISDGWALSNVGRCAMRGCTEAQAIAWCLKGVLP